jgi:hypothetical protein
MGTASIRCCCPAGAWHSMRWSTVPLPLSPLRLNPQAARTKWPVRPRCCAMRCAALRCCAVRCDALRCGAVRCRLYALLAMCRDQLHVSLSVHSGHLGCSAAQRRAAPVSVVSESAAQSAEWYALQRTSESADIIAECSCEAIAMPQCYDTSTVHSIAAAHREQCVCQPGASHVAGAAAARRDNVSER